MRRPTLLIVIGSIVAAAGASTCGTERAGEMLVDAGEILRDAGELLDVGDASAQAIGFEPVSLSWHTLRMTCAEISACVDTLDCPSLPVPIDSILVSNVAHCSPFGDCRAIELAKDARSGSVWPFTYFLLDEECGIHGLQDATMMMTIGVR